MKRVNRGRSNNRSEDVGYQSLMGETGCSLGIGLGDIEDDEGILGQRGISAAIYKGTARVGFVG